MDSWKILVTNDDGPKSPFVHPFIRALRDIKSVSEVRCVFPAEEQSWISQAVTRFRPIYAAEHDFDGTAGFLASGTPADCVGLGLHHLWPAPADLVVSGINIGTNATLPFFMNSGTVGAARQAFCFGARAVAFSSLIPGDIFTRWREEDFSIVGKHAPDWKRISEVCAALTEKFFEPDVWEGVDLYSVNVPFEAAVGTECMVTKFERPAYEPLYTLEGRNAYTHHFQGFRRSKSTETGLPDDLATVQAGKISITPICCDFQPRTPVSKKLRARFE